MSTSSPPTADLPKPGDLLVGKYRVERVIGQGGMGIVYAAVHELLGQRVAVKLLLGANSADASARFLNEARAAARIQHENIARVMDVGMLPNGLPYMVLELLDGSDLEAVLERDGKLAVGTAVDYVLQALEAVAQAHAVGIVHRDLKPANMFLARKIDGSSQIKVLDFGISKSNDGLLSAAKTSTQAILGSPYYMSPEQLKSARSVDRRADIWSVGVILYQLLTGAYPFNGESVGELFAAILAEPPLSPLELRPDCPPGLVAVIFKCLTRDPALRYDGAAELAQALAPFATARGVASAERIRPIVPATVPPPVLGGVPSGPVPAQRQTAASWHFGASHRVPGRARSYAWAVVVTVVLGVGAAAFVVRTRSAIEAKPAPAADPGPISAAAPVAGAESVTMAQAPSAAAPPTNTPVVSAAPLVATALPVASAPHGAPLAPGRPTKPAAAAPTTTVPARPVSGPVYDPTRDSRN